MKTPLAIGYLEPDASGDIIFVDDPRSHLRIYEWPGSKAVIGSDVAEGLEIGDDHASIVLGLRSNDTMAAYNTNKPDPDQFAIFNKMLGLFYNKAFIGVERNSVGFSVVSDLIKIYPISRIYFHMRLDERTKKETKKFGWITDERTRHLILKDLKQEIRESSTELLDKQLINQGMRFVNVDGKPQASAGAKDDLVMARAIAGRMRRHRLSKVDLPDEAPVAEWKVY